MDFTETSVNIPEVAEPVETNSIDGTVATPEVEVAGANNPESAAPEKQDYLTNAIYAEARRNAEAEARRKAELQQKERDARFAQRFKGFTNPQTGAAITSEKEYFEALDAQERIQAQQKLQESGLSADFLDKLIAQNPTVRQAQEIMAQTQRQEADRQLASDLAEIAKIDPNIKSLADLAATENFQAILQMVNENHLSVLDAYKIANFDSITNKRADAAKQAAINSAKSKDHLETTNTVSAKDKQNVSIPADQIGRWRESYPGLTDAELTAKYNAVL